MCTSYHRMPTAKPCDVRTFAFTFENDDKHLKIKRSYCNGNIIHSYIFFVKSSKESTLLKFTFDIFSCNNNSCVSQWTSCHHDKVAHLILAVGLIKTKKKPKIGCDQFCPTFSPMRGWALLTGSLSLEWYVQSN